MVTNILSVRATRSIATVLVAGLSLNLAACQRAPSQHAGGTSASTAGHASASNGTGGVELLNVSYDVSRELYKSYNTWFSQDYQAKHKTAVTVQQSHGGSSKQALSVANGLQADVVTMNQGSDIELLVKKGLVEPNWQQALPNNAVPYTSTMVLLVRNHNPKNIKDWDDLAKNGVGVVIANPKTSGTARYGFLAAYGYGLHKFNNEDKTKDFMRHVLANVQTYDSGARAATTTFAQRQIGDALITTENEAHIAKQQFASDNLEIVYPSYSIKIDNPVAVVTAVTNKKGTTAIAKDYLQGLWSENAQKTMAENYLRPSDAKVLATYQQRFPSITTFSPNQVFGSWDAIMTKFFKDGAIFDMLSAKN